MKQSLSTEKYISLEHSPNKYHSLDLYVNNKIRNFRVNRKLKILEYNSRFWAGINKNQETFLLFWSRKYVKYGSSYKADKLALKSYQKLNLPVEDVMALYKDALFHSNKIRHDRLFKLATITKTELFFINLFNNIKKWLNMK